MVERERKKIWKNTDKKEIGLIIEEGLEILKKKTQKATKEFEAFIRKKIGEEEILG
ncbi:MAG: hypothetical protein ACTSRL_21005 [Candidatus Helarchaeota archaeon]